MSQIRISQLVTLNTISGDDLLVIVRSGSSAELTTFKTSVQDINDDYFSISGSVASASFSVHVITTPTASNSVSSSYSKTGSLGYYLNYDGSLNGTASWAVNVLSSTTSSLSNLVNSASTAISSSYAIVAVSASFVASSSFATRVGSAITTSVTTQTPFAYTASYVDISSLQNFPKWYGPFTASGYSGSIYGWTDPIFRGIPVTVLYDDTDLIFQGVANVIRNSAGDTDDPDGPHFLQLRWKEITSSANPGTYQEPNYTEQYSTADDVVEGNTYYGGGGYKSVINYSFMFSKKNVKKGSYILWFESKYFRNTSISNRTYGTIHTDELYTSANGTPNGLAEASKIPSVNLIYDVAQSLDTNNQHEQWIWPSSGSINTTIYATKKVKQGIMFAPTASVSHRSSPTPHYDYIGQLYGGGFGRVYAVPFLVNQSSINVGFCRATFTYVSGSKSLSAIFTASTAGSSVGDTVVAFSGSLPGTSNTWIMTTNDYGVSLTTIPIRIDVSSSWNSPA